MKLITEAGELILPEDFSFTIKQNSPAFSLEGSQSIPVTLPASQINYAALNYPERPGKNSKYIRKIPAKLEAGIFHKSGQLVIDTAHKKDGITGAIMINESDLYSQIKDITLEEVFGKIVRTDISGVENWYSHIYACMVGTAIDDFTAFPVAVNLDDEKYQLLNGPDTSSELDTWALKYKARRITYDGQAVNVPDGYGITPFLFLWRVLELLFADFDYSIRANPFKSNDFLKKIVLINNTADAICKGSLNYSDLVPSITIAEFVTWLEAKFAIHLYIYPEKKVLDLIGISNVVTSVPQMDVTGILDGNEKYIYSDTQEVNISSDTSLEGASPAADTLIKLGEKYESLNELDEYDWEGNAWKYSLVFRKATGEYYEIHRREGDSSVKKVRLGSNYFTHFTDRLEESKYEAIDLMPTMIEANLGMNGIKKMVVICPYIGDSRHRNTSYTESSSAVDQKIILALNAGLSDEDAVTEAKYNIGTTQKYNNLGVQWSLYDLTAQSLYALFWREWNKVLMNSGVTIEAKIDFTSEQLLSLRIDQPVMLKGQKCLVKNINYSVGKKIVNNTGEYMVLRNLTPIIDDIEVSFTPDLYRWQYENNAAEIFAPFDTQEWDNYTWDYSGVDAPSKAIFEFIPAPTAAQFTAGGLYYEQSNAIRIAAKKINETALYYFDEVLISGFRPILIEN